MKGVIMILQPERARRRRVIVDVNTQNDFFLAGGKACVRNHHRRLVNIRRIMAWARAKHIIVISTCFVNPQTTHSALLNEKVLCADGSMGQRKVRFTLLWNRISFPAEDRNNLPMELLLQYQQIVFHTRHIDDPTKEPRAERLLDELNTIQEYILIGAPAEMAVKETALALLQRDRCVTVIVDALGAYSTNEARIELRKLESKGAKLIETKRIFGGEPVRMKPIRACGCRMCRESSIIKPQLDTEVLQHMQTHQNQQKQNKVLVEI
jgi:nicotinamidase-related amidase